MGESVEVGELIAVLSGKGGTGKTSVCAGIATALAASGRRVLCIDCDVGSVSYTHLTLPTMAVV